ncbi:MAG: hypothetical protein AAGG51_25985 [Cyanobacteria bacterium P01_G01_bin.54]
MSDKYFHSGNYIYECKTSPSKRDMDVARLNAAIGKLRKVWERGKKPSGYRYLFPINTLSSKSIQSLKSLQSDYPEVDIRWYESAEVEKLIANLREIGSMSDLVSYISKAQAESLR